MGFRGDLEALVIGVLATGAMHGYDLTRRINNLEGVKIQDGQLYPILHRLEADGHIAAEWVPQEGRPNRKIYSLTESGNALLAQKQADWSVFASSVSALLNPTLPALPTLPEVKNA
jgi:PadR family transcriptional regulator, regulatory protein PadR